MSLIRTGVDADRGTVSAPRCAGGAETSSVNEFHAPQFGHFPAHRALSKAHAWQTYVDLILAMMSR